MVKILDAHSHWMPAQIAEKTSFFKQSWSDIDLLLHTMDASSVEKAVLLYPTSDAHLKMHGWQELCLIYNTELSKKVKEHPDRLIGAGILPIDNPENMLVELERIKELGFRSLSLASSYDGNFLDNEIFQAVLERAEKESFVIFVHSQIINPIGFERVNDPLLMPVVEYLFDITMCAGRLMMSQVLRRLKNLKFVFAHFAGVLPFLRDRFDSTYSMLRARNMVGDLHNLPSEILKNIYVDTSGVKSEGILNMAIDFFGADKILWGSDFPAKKDLLEGIAAIKNLDIAKEKKAMMLGGNLKRLLK